MTTRRAFAPRPIATGWLLAIGIDVFFNAGLFGALFDQAREPALLPDDVLFMRIPVAYAALLLGVGTLAWLLDRIDTDDVRSALVAGIGFGGLIAVLGPVYLWTAIDMSAGFVAAAVLVLIVEFGSVGTSLQRFRSGGRLRTTLITAVAAAVAGIVLQNVL